MIAPATEFNSELNEIWGDRPINSQKEVEGSYALIG